MPRFMEDDDLTDDIDTQDDLETDPGRVDARGGSQDWDEKLRERGFTDDEISAHKRNFVPKSVFTRKTQEYSQRSQQQEQRLARLEGAISGHNGNNGTGQRNSNGGGEVDEIDRELADITESNPEVAKLLKRVAEVSARKGARMALEQAQPYFNTTQNVARLTTANQVAQQRGRFVDRFGKEAMEQWPEVERIANDLLDKGMPVNLNAIFQGLDEDFHDDCVSRQRERKRRKQQEQRRHTGTEGFSQQRSREPLRSPDMAARKEANGDDDDGAFDFRALADEIQREVGMVFRR